MFFTNSYYRNEKFVNYADHIDLEGLHEFIIPTEDFEFLLSLIVNYLCMDTLTISILEFLGLVGNFEFLELAGNKLLNVPNDCFGKRVLAVLLS